MYTMTQSAITRLNYIAMRNLKISILLSTFFYFGVQVGTAQQASNSEMVIDQVVGVVGGNIILQSEIDAQFQQLATAQESIDEKTRCKLLEELLYQKMLLAQAQRDSLP